MDKPRPNPNSSSSPTSTIKEVEGQELGEEERVWREIDASEARLALMKNMVKEKLAFADLEEFGINFARENLKSRIAIWTRPDNYFSIGKLKSGRVQN